MTKASESYAEEIISRLTKDEVLAGGNKLGISKEQITDDLVELVKIKGNKRWYADTR